MTAAKPKGGKLETVKGTGNVFRDLGKPDAELRQLKALPFAKPRASRAPPPPTFRACGAPTSAASPSTA
jgi:hypothetical protein